VRSANFYLFFKVGGTSVYSIFNIVFGFPEVDSVFDMEFDPPGTKPKRVHLYFSLKALKLRM
jgi:hypothetical protein